MSEFDIYLNGQGYMLAKDGKGGLASGAAREQIVDPFTRALSQDEPYTRAPFRFGDGAGLTEYDSSNRYEWGNCVDSRSGKLVPSPERLEAGAPYYQRVIDTLSTIQDNALDNGTGHEGAAERFTTPAGVTTVRSLAILVKRHTAKDYSAAATFQVQLWDDAAGPVPNVSLGTAQVSIRQDLDPYSPFVDRWRNGEYFWLEVVLAADVVIGASTPFWISVINNQASSLYWGQDSTGSMGSTRSWWDGAAWTNGAADYPLMIKLGYKDGTNQYDSFPRCFQVYAGIDLIERVYCGTGYRILTWDPTWSASDWTESKTVGTPVTQLLEFDELLFAACGPLTDIWYSDGTTKSTVWTQVSGQQANAFAIYDNMLWKADLHVVGGSLTGLAWAATTVDVGDPGTPVTALVAHGGKLFAAKPEGIYEISYPDTYPTSGTPTCNLLLDFNTERSPRTWLMDWHSGLYFSGLGGIYELKFDVLRNLWVDKVDEGAIDTVEATSPAAYTRPRSWSPLYDKGPVAWSAVHGTTRGLLCARSNPHTETSDIVWFDGSNWYSLRAAGTLATDGSPYDFAEYITACFVQDAGGGRGWLWYNEGFGISRTEWPTWTEDTIDDGTVEYEQRSQATTPWFSLGEQTKEMLLCKIGVVSKNLTSTIHIDVSYRLNDATAWTSLGKLDTSPYMELDFAASTTARRIQFLLALDVGSTGSHVPPIAEQVDLFYQTMPCPTHTHQLILSCEADHSMREAGVDERTSGQIMTQLRALVGNPGFAYIDLLGTSHTCRVTAVTGQMMNLLTGPGPESVGVTAQAIVSLLET